MLRHCLALLHGVVVEHLRCQRDTGDGRLQLVRHIVDEVVLNLGESLLSEHEHQRDDKRDEQDEREHQRRNQKAYRREDVFVHPREVDAHHTRLVLRIVLEKQLRIGILLTLVDIVGTTVYLAPILRGNSEMIGDVNAVVHQFSLKVLVEQLEVDTLIERFLRSGVEDAIDHFVEQCFLINIAVSHNLTHRLRGLRNGVFVVAQNHRLGHICRFRGNGLEFERGIYRTVVSGHRVLVRLLDATVGHGRTRTHGVVLNGASLCGVDILFQETERLVEFQISGSLIERLVDTLIKLFLLHLDHRLHVLQLYIEQGEERKPHHGGNNHNCCLFHGGKYNTFCNMTKVFR